MTATTGEFVKRYIAGTKDILDRMSADEIVRVIDILHGAYREGKQVFIMGNGGSAATASHMACDLGKGAVIEGKPRFRVWSLVDNTSLLTAISNDLGYDSVFMEQLANLVNEGDVAIVISGSGNSENVLKAVRYARSRGAITVGFLGFGGGKLKDLVDCHVIVPSFDYGQVESIHQLLEHLVTEYFRERLRDGKEP